MKLPFNNKKAKRQKLKQNCLENKYRNNLNMKIKMRQSINK